MTLRRFLLGFVVVMLAVVAVVGLAGRAALSAAAALERARSGLTSFDPSGSSLPEALLVLRRAQDDLAQAQDDLDDWPVELVSRIPVLGRSLRVERAVARTAAEVVDGAAALAEGLPTVRRQGGVDLAALQALHTVVDGTARDARRGVDDLRGSSTALTPGPVVAARRDALRALDPAVITLQRASDALRLVGDLLGASGDRSVLVMVQNNAELRGAGGYAATFATGRTSGGRLELDPLRDVIAVADPPAVAERVPAPPEYAQDYGPLSGNTTIWRSWNMSPHVPDSALVGARVAGVLLGQEPDVVVLVDVPAMTRLAALGDGVVLPDGARVSPQELGDALLVDAYQDAGVGLASQERRRDELRAAATATFSELLSGGLPPAEVARTVADLTAGRHLTVWSAASEEQAVLEELGAAGALAAPPDGDLSHVSVNNVGANKLDLYVDRSLSVDVVVGPSQASVVQRVQFENEAPEGLVPYVAGKQRPGTVMSRVELSVPPTAVDVSATLDGTAWPGRIDVGLTRTRLPVRVDTPRGATSTLEVRYRVPVPDGAYDLRLVPQPLVRDATARVSVRPVDGARLVGEDVQDGVLLHEGPLDRTLELSVRLVDAR